ncbi:diuretic hormone class 2 isoform X2 [Culicoides brevitarsis]|uniref:diuretic hormone class 2 isoform X2 n=1 Tax=Culicoides brevitarsis TaxID=469753 RepID=UPI00307B1BC5
MKNQYIYAVILLIPVICSTTIADSLRFRNYVNEFGEPNEDALLELIARYGQTILRAKDDLENSKRTVDFGLSRGYSGAQEAKHRMAMAIANFAGGPGRRRRSYVDKSMGVAKPLAAELQ